MASARSKLLNSVTRVLMRVIFRERKPVAEYREIMERLDQKRIKPLPSDITTEDANGPVLGRWVRNAKATSAQVILYLPGGAFIMRLPHGHTHLVARICQQTGASAFMAFYRLAPEHRFPAGPEDCLAAYRSLLAAGHQPGDIVIMGDSAGGNLALALLHQIRAAKLPMPSGVVALSPITDFVQVSATWRMNRWRDPMYRVQGFVNPVEWYLQGASPMDPVASPYYGDLTGFPPMYFLVGGLEALLDDSVGMVRKAIESGVRAKLHIWQGMPHVFLLRDFLPESRLALREVAAWLTALRKPASPVKAVYDDCVEFFELQAFTGRVRRETNNAYLDVPSVKSGGGI